MGISPRVDWYLFEFTSLPLYTTEACGFKMNASNIHQPLGPSICADTQENVLKIIPAINDTHVPIFDMHTPGIVAFHSAVIHVLFVIGMAVSLVLLLGPLWKQAGQQWNV